MEAIRKQDLLGLGVSLVPHGGAEPSSRASSSFFLQVEYKKLLFVVCQSFGLWDIWGSLLLKGCLANELQHIWYSSTLVGS